MHYNKQCVCVYIKFVRLSCTFAHLQLITLSYVYVINEHTCTCLRVALYIHCMLTHVLADCSLCVLVHVHSMLVCVCAFMYYMYYECTCFYGVCGQNIHINAEKRPILPL